MTRSVIFDCDGVLVDTELISNTVLAGLLTEAGLPTTLEHCMTAYRGRSIGSVLEIAEAQLGSEMPFDVAGRYYADAAEIFARELRPVPGVIAALDRIDAAVVRRLQRPAPQDGGHAAHDRPVGALRRPHLQLQRGRARQAGARPVPARRRADGLRSREHRGRRGQPAGIEAAVAAGMRALAFTRHSDAAELAAAGGEPFDDMADLPALLAA